MICNRSTLCRHWASITGRVAEKVDVSWRCFRVRADHIVSLDHATELHCVSWSARGKCRKIMGFWIFHGTSTGT